MVFHYLNHNVVETITGFTPVAIVTAVQAADQHVPDGLVWISYAAAASTLLLNVPKIWKGLKGMFKEPGECPCKEEDE